MREAAASRMTDFRTPLATHSALRSVVVANANERVKMPINERLLPERNPS